MKKKHKKRKRTPFNLFNQDNKNSIIHRRSAPGAGPGTLIPDPDSPQPEYQIIKYNKESHTENLKANLADILIEDLPENQITWINIEGLGDVTEISQIGSFFGLHPLAMEDVINVHQRPKVDHYKNGLFIVARMPHAEGLQMTEQVTFFLNQKFLLTFQEGTPGDSFEPVRRRLRKDSGRIRSSGAKYLFYALLDSLIDHYFPQVEYYANMLEEIEDRLIAREQVSFTSEIYSIRRNLMQIQRNIRPLQDVIQSLMRDNNPLFSDETQIYLRDCLDHTAQLLDMLDTYYSLATHLMEMAEAAADHRLNEIMRFLTVMSSIFIPLTFIAGLYGMNFNSDVSPWNMPELNWHYGYPGAIIVMLCSIMGLLIFFRKKGWLGIPDSD